MTRSQAWRNYDFDLLKEGRLFFYVGAGLSQAAGLVGWNQMAKAISRFRREYESDVSDRPPPRDHAKENAAYLRRFVEEKDPQGNVILSRDSTDVRTFARTVYLNFLLRCQRQSLKLFSENDLEFHHAVWQTRCQGIFTTNYDMLLEEAFNLIPPSQRHPTYGHPAALRTYRYYARFLPFLLSVPRFVLKLHGDIDDIGTMLFDPETAWDQNKQLDGRVGDDLRHVFDAALRSGHMIYIGCGGRDRTFRELHQWRGRTQHISHQRLFFVPANELASICKGIGNATEGLLFLTYGDSQVPPTRDLAASELKEFLGALTNCAASRPMYFSNEAAELSSQIKSNSRLTRKWITPSWEVSGVKLPALWNDGSPPGTGRYLWRRKEGNRRPFFASVEEMGTFLSVELEGHEHQWRGDRSQPLDELLLFYEWIGPVDE